MNRQGLPQEHYTFTAIECKSTFSKGKFEQELTGKLVTDEIKAPTTAGTGRPAATAAATSSRPGAIPQSQADAQDLENGANAGTGTSSTLPDDGSHGYAIQDETGQVSNIRKNEYGDLYYPATTQPAPPPGAPTSSGDIAPANTTTDPPTMPGPNATADQFNFNGVQPTPDELSARNAYRAAGSPSSGPLYDSYASSKAAFASRITDARSATTSTPPQQIARDD